MLDDGIPAFLKLTDEQRRKAWEKFSKNKKEETASISEKRAWRPQSISQEEWDKSQAEKKEAQRLREQEAQRLREAKKPAPVDHTGMRWDGLKGKWVVDRFAHLCGLLNVPAQPKKAVQRTVNRKAVPANAFGIPEGTNRDKLAKAMAKRLGEMVTLKEWSKAVYGSVSEGPCSRVMDGFIYVIKKNRLKFEVVKDKNDKGEVVFGLFETE